MSMAIKRASYTGDPGLFGNIFGAIKGAVSGFIGKPPPIPTAGPGSFPLGGAYGSAFGGGGGLAAQCAASGKVPDPSRPGKCMRIPGGVPAPGFMAFTQRAVPFGATGMMAPEMNGCPPNMSGYHLNKSAYFLMSGEFVAEGSRYVKNRKRNPANARATSRAIGRITGAKMYAKSLSRISIRKKC